MDQQVLIVLVTSVTLSVVLGLVLGRYGWPHQPIDAGALAELRQELARHEHECGELRLQARSLTAERSEIAEQARLSGHECAALTERVKGLLQQIDRHMETIRGADAARMESVEKARLATAEIASLSEREKHLADKVESQTVQLDALQTKLTTEFENIANRILEANSSQLSKTSNQSLSALLGPLQEKISEFQKKVEDTYSSERSEVISLKEQIRIALDVSQTVGQKADDLAKALRGKSQQLGSWGELILERILEDAGLKEGREYITQGRGLQLKSDEGGAVRPDVIVNLTQGRSLIVDSKVPLAAYERLVMTEDSSERDVCRNQFLRDVRGHIDDLAGKRYQDNAQLQAHEFAMLFMPVESSLYEAINSDPGLFNYAWTKSVVLVGPSTLLATMRTVASIWRHEKQAENAQKIARDAGLLLDKLSNSVDDLNRVGAKLSEATDWHNKAMGRLFTGKGNAMSIGKRIREAGIKTKQTISNPMVDGTLLATAAYDNDDEIETEAADPASPDDPDLTESLLEDRTFEPQNA